MWRKPQKMVPKTYFDYSRYNLYKKCPLSFLWTYIEKRIPKTPANLYYTLNGSAIQKLFELFYNEQWYLKRDKCREFIYQKAPEVYESVLKYTYVNWEDSICKKNKQQLYEEYLETIPKALNVIKQYKLLGQFAKSEQKIQGYLEENRYTILNSKVDFLICNEVGTQILDGKYTSGKARYMKDPTQLYFYALIFNLRYNKYPDKIGFWFWKDSEIQYVDVDKDKIEALKTDIQDTLYAIHKKKFDPKPEYSNCMWCSFKEECPARDICIANKKLEKNGIVTSDDLKALL